MCVSGSARRLIFPEAMMHFTSRTKQTDSQPTILCIIIIQMFAGSEGGIALEQNLSRIKFWLRSKIKP